MVKKSRDKTAPTANPNEVRTPLEAPSANDHALVEWRLNRDIRHSMWIPDGASKAEIERLGDAAIALARSIKPTDEIEGMLSAQMVAAHNAAMECSFQALNTNSLRLREQMLKHAAKLMSIYVRQVEALDKHRGKGQQKVTVEKHIYVQPGGQVVAGDVAITAHHSSADGQSADAPKEITQALEQPFEMTSHTLVPVKQGDK